MVGAELRDNDNWTLSILTNPAILRLLKHSFKAKQIQRTTDTVIWVSEDEDGSKYVAFFNTAFTQTEPEVSFMNLGIKGTYKAKNLWTNEYIGEFTGRIGAKVNIHGAVIYKLTKVESKVVVVI